MFGQEPRLPIDFLLARVHDEVPGEIRDRVFEHRARLRVTFEGTLERSLAAASRGNVWHDWDIRDAPFPLA